MISSSWPQVPGLGFQEWAWSWDCHVITDNKLFLLIMINAWSVSVHSRVTYSGKLLFESNKEKFSFRRGEGQKIWSFKKIWYPKALSYAKEWVMLESKLRGRNKTRKPCCLKETAQLFFSVLSSPTKFTTSLRVAKLESRASQLQTYDTKQILTQNGDSRSFKVTCFGVSGKAIRH